MTAPTTCSYDPAATTAGGLDAEVARLEAQAELSFDDELPVLRALGISGPVLEIGCGPGAVVRRLRQALPGTDAVFGLDVDRRLLSYATDSGVPLVAGDGHRLPLRTGTFGTVLLRYVIQHFADPAALLAEARRVLRPGGLLVLIDVDAELWGVAEPIYPELASVHARVATAQGAAGGDRMVGRRLTRMLRAAELESVVLRTFSTTSDEHPVEAFEPHLGPSRLAPYLTAGVLSLRDVALAADRWGRFLRHPDTWIMLLGFVAAGRKPARPAIDRGDMP